MIVRNSTLHDFQAWLALAGEVEHLFGPMAHETSFQEALKQAISNKTAFCIRTENNGLDTVLPGGIVISREANEIAWLAVSNGCRGKGYGSSLLRFAIDRLDRQKSILVQTFDDSVPEGAAARALYKNFGFIDYKKGGLNPAGVPTVIMKRPTGL